MTNSGILYVVGTPIGNREDITIRALRILAEVDVVVCEDTRVTSRLLSLYEETKLLKKHLARLDENFELRMIPKVLTWLETGTSVALVTDAGMPTISDPGWRVVDAVREAGYRVEVIPGPTALTAGLATVGMDASKVWFVGFLPKKDGKRQEILTEVVRQLKEHVSTAVVFYESPNRLKNTLEVLKAFDVTVAVCGELTKQYEKVIRGSVQVVLDNLPVEVKGEWVVVVSL